MITNFFYSQTYIIPCCGSTTTDAYNTRQHRYAKHKRRLMLLQLYRGLFVRWSKPCAVLTRSGYGLGRGTMFHVKR